MRDAVLVSIDRGERREPGLQLRELPCGGRSLWLLGAIRGLRRAAALAAERPPQLLMQRGGRVFRGRLLPLDIESDRLRLHRRHQIIAWSLLIEPACAFCLVIARSEAAGLETPC